MENPRGFRDTRKDLEWGMSRVFCRFCQVFRDFNTRTLGLNVMLQISCIFFSCFIMFFVLCNDVRPISKVWVGAPHPKKEKTVTLC